MAERIRKELIGTGFALGGEAPRLPEINYPIPPKENFKLFLDGRRHMYMPNSALDVQMLMPKDDPDCHIPIFEDGFDGFGTHWTFVKQVGAAMVTPGTKALNDIEDWETGLQWPHLDKYDFSDGIDGICARMDQGKMTHTLLGHGLFERLHSCVGFAEALEAFIVSPDAVHSFFDALTRWKLDYLEKLFAQVPYEIDIVTYADDMGTQKDTFFSPKIFEEFFYGRVKTIFDYIHSRGKYINYHSCGNNTRFAEYYVSLGADMWEAQRDANDFTGINAKTGGRLNISTGLDAALLSDPNAADEEILDHVRGFVDGSLPLKNVAGLVYAGNQRTADLVLPELVRYSAERYR
jgi:hypothetical protein